MTAVSRRSAGRCGRPVSTDTSCETPFSAMVTPNSRCIRANGQPVVGDYQEAGAGGGEIVQQCAHAIDVGVVELVRQPGRGRKWRLLGEEDRKAQCQGGECLFAAGEQRQMLQFFAG